MSRHILVVTTAPVEGEALRDRVLEDADDGGAEVKVVATASDLSPLDWLANDEDDARAEAESRAEGVGRAIAPGAERVEAAVGDTDPVQAIEDALRTFPADELVLVTRKEDDAGWLEEGAADEALARFNLPVKHLVVDES